MTWARLRRGVALVTVAVALASCNDGAPKAETDASSTSVVGSPPGGAPTSAGEPSPGVAGATGGAATASGGAAGTGGAAGGGATATGALPGGASGTGGLPGSAAATGGQPGGTATVGGAQTTPPGSSSGEAGTGTGSTGAVPPAPSGGGSGSSEPSIVATAEECAALNELMTIIDHPDLHALKARTNC